MTMFRFMYHALVKFWNSGFRCSGKPCETRPRKTACVLVLSHIQSFILIQFVLSSPATVSDQYERYFVPSLSPSTDRKPSKYRAYIYRKNQRNLRIFPFSRILLMKLLDYKVHEIFQKKKTLLRTPGISKREDSLNFQPRLFFHDDNTFPAGKVQRLHEAELSCV